MRTVSCELCWSGIACLFLVLTPNLSAVNGSSEFSDWSEPVNLGPPVNSALEELDSFLSKDGRSLYFGSLRPGGFGGNDIWVAQRTSVTKPWGVPENLGPVINSPFNDGQPALSDDGQWLFFNSNRPGGLGGQDPVAGRRSNRNAFGWEEPVNLGEVVNSTGNDTGALWFTEHTGLMTLFFASDRPGGMGGDDLYAIRFSQVERWVRLCFLKNSVPLSLTEIP